jgi:hypothetical protein
VSGANPVGAGEAGKLTRIEPARTAGVEVLDACAGILELGLLNLTVSQAFAGASMAAMGTPIEALDEPNAELMAQRRE